jgi:alanyl-tRNA synthetase
VNVVNCQVYGGFVVHVCEVVSDVDFALRVGDEVICAVDYERRGLIAPNHTMTHVLNYAIRKVLLGDSVSETVSAKGTCDQRGSLVDADKLRFDFSWNGSLSPEEIRAVETIVNQTIQESQPVYAQEVALSLAQGISSLRSVFGERYPDPVRVLSVGVDVNELVAQPDNVAWRGHSVEFCGGTHLTNTAQAEKFVLIEECGIAKGIRRITGLTRVGAHQATATAASLMSRIEELINMTPGAELNTATKLIKLEVDRATVSLVDKEQMRAGLGVVNEKLKNWLKASLAERTDSALAKIVEIAEVANANQQVRCRPSLTALLSHSSSDCHRRGNGLWWRGQSGEEDSRQAQDSPP